MQQDTANPLPSDQVRSSKFHAYLQTADQHIEADWDHLVDPTADELAWLAAQLAAWPTRVDERYTTNDRFLRVSAANFIVAMLRRSA